MQCPKCRTDNLSDALFCEECGAALEAPCPACGAGNRPAAKFCRKCRTPLNGGAGAAVTPTERRAPVAKHLADRILGARAALEGERKLVTVLFADVKGSMDLAEQLDPEQWSAIMKRFFVILSEGVERFEGYVDKFTGDGIMALFGAPIAHEDHARRACYAALHVQDGLRAYANELRLCHGLNFSARMGINSGEVIVGKIGDDLRMDYTAQGHTVGLAARMEQIAEPGKVYLTAHTARELEGYFALADLGELSIKGAHDAVHVHELLGLGTARTRLDVSRSRGFSRFVGRGDEMQLLEAALTRAREGNGQVVGIDEARALAHALGKPSALAVPLAGLAGRTAMAGRVQAALDLATEASGLLDESAEVEAKVATGTAYTFCASVAGLLLQAEDAVDRVAAHCSGDQRIGHKLLGYSALMWADFQKGWLLGQAGRFDECWPLVERSIRTAREQGEQEVLGREAEGRVAGRNDSALLHAGLREAEAMYRAMGAPDPADRLVQEIESM